MTQLKRLRLFSLDCGHGRCNRQSETRGTGSTWGSKRPLQAIKVLALQATTSIGHPFSEFPEMGQRPTGVST